MSNYLNQIESDLYKLYSITNGSGEVVEMVTELKEKYEKAKAYDHIENLVKTELTSDDLYNDARNNDYSAGMLRVYERVDYIIDEYESGGYDA